jgi:hypothetical protein
MKIIKLAWKTAIGYKNVYPSSNLFLVFFDYIRMFSWIKDSEI